MIVATAEINTAAVLVHLEDGALLVLRHGMLTSDDIREVAAVLEDVAVSGKKNTAALCLIQNDRTPVTVDGEVVPG